MDTAEQIQSDDDTVIKTKTCDRMAAIQDEISAFQSKYGLTFERFYNSVTTDEDFVQKIRFVHPAWERDFNAWEYYVEELNDSHPET